MVEKNTGINGYLFFPTRPVPFFIWILLLPGGRPGGSGQLHSDNFTARTGMQAHNPRLEIIFTFAYPYDVIYQSGDCTFGHVHPWGLVPRPFH